MPEYPAPPTVTDVEDQFSDRHRPMLLAAIGADFASEALADALVWLDAQGLRHGLDVDLAPEPTGVVADDNRTAIRLRILRQAVLKRAEYEAWSRTEREAVARDKRQDADDLLAGIVGASYDPGAPSSGDAAGGPERRPAAAASVCPPSRSALSLAMRARRGP